MRMLCYNCVLLLLSEMLLLLFSFNHIPSQNILNFIIKIDLYDK